MTNPKYEPTLTVTCSKLTDKTKLLSTKNVLTAAQALNISIREEARWDGPRRLYRWAPKTTKAAIPRRASNSLKREWSLKDDVSGRSRVVCVFGMGPPVCKLGTILI